MAKTAMTLKQQRKQDVYKRQCLHNMRPPSILYKMMWGKIERQAAFSEEAYGSGTPLNMRILYRKKGIRKIAQKEKIFQENFV